MWLNHYRYIALKVLYLLLHWCIRSKKNIISVTEQLYLTKKFTICKLLLFSFLIKMNGMLIKNSFLIENSDSKKQNTNHL